VYDCEELVGLLTGDDVDAPANSISDLERNMGIKRTRKNKIRWVYVGISHVFILKSGNPPQKFVSKRGL